MLVAAAKAFARLIPTCESHFFRRANHFLQSEQTVNEQILARMRSAKMIFDPDMQACSSTGR
jgi:chemotaxis methyl-accepting protein methylase